MTLSDPTREALDAVFNALLTSVVAEMKVVGDSYESDDPTPDGRGMISRMSVAQGFRYYASSWLADRIKNAHQQALAALSTPPPSLDAASTRRYANGGNLPDPGTPAPSLDIDRLARALCASRDPEVAATADLFIDDECRLLARRIAHEYARSDE